ncbi:IspD/TarI family cytidylyltransferase [Stomatohabitans albus]|uniref:IspD/TarI family cytidylyltransferase n=1 Tax=Stomatohabitans albus TaxID=3110766 RepID=UPI00300CF55A
MHEMGQSSFNNSGRSIVAIVLAGGSGTRFSDEVNKVYVPLADRTVIEHSLDTLDANPSVQAIQVVVREQDVGLWEEVSARRAWHKLIGHVVGGGTRHDSEWAGLQAIAPHFAAETVVLMHDAARPFLTHELISGLVQATQPGQGGVPAHSLRADVLADDPSLTTGNLVTVQTPQAFILGDLLDAYSRALDSQFHAVDTSQTIEEFSDVRVMMIPSDPRNIKITRKADLDTAQDLLLEFANGQWLVDHP